MYAGPGSSSILSDEVSRILAYVVFGLPYTSVLSTSDIIENRKPLENEVMPWPKRRLFQHAAVRFSVSIPCKVT